jgi:hypothetical protein
MCVHRGQHSDELNYSYSQYSSNPQTPLYPGLYDYQQDHQYAPQFPSAPAAPILTQTIHERTLQLLSKAHETANSILGSDRVTPITSQRNQAASSVPSAPVFVNFSQPEYNVFSSRTVHHHHYGRGEGEDDSGKRTFAVIIGTVVAGVSAYLFGKITAENEEAQANEESLNSLEQDWKENQHIYTWQPNGSEYIQRVNTIVNKTHVILNRQASNRHHKQAIIVAFLAAGILGVTGGIIASHALMTTGLVLGIGAGLFGLYKLGYQHFSQLDLKDAKAIEQNLNLVSGYTFNMN